MLVTSLVHDMPDMLKGHPALGRPGGDTVQTDQSDLAPKERVQRFTEMSPRVPAESWLEFSEVAKNTLKIHAIYINLCYVG